MNAAHPIYALLIATVLSFSSNAFAQERMTTRMRMIKAPVPNATQTRDLVFYADRPGDLLRVTQKPSAKQVQLRDQLLTAEQILAAYSSRIGASEAATAVSSGYRVIGNFIDGVEGKKMFDEVGGSSSQLWQAVILNRQTVNEAILQLEWFNSGLGGHAQIRFKLSYPILLVSQSDRNVTKFIDGDLIYALMAVRTQGGSQDFGAVNGLTGAFATSYILASTRHMASIQMNLSNGSFIEQFRMNLSAAQKQNLFSFVQTTGTLAGTNEIYSLVFNSCVTAAMRAIRTIDSRVDAWEFNPYNVVPSLSRIGLIGDQLTSFNEEFSAPVRALASPDNQRALAIVEKLRSVMGTRMFTESLRVLAAILIEDRWTTDELNSLIASIQNRTLPTVKTAATAQRLLDAINDILVRNRLEMSELLTYLSQAAGIS